MSNYKIHGHWIFLLYISLAGFWACSTLPDEEEMKEKEEEQEQMETPSIDRDVDQNIVAQLPLNTRSFDMGTAGFVPSNYPDPGETDWSNFFEYGAALYGGIYGVHISPASEADDQNVPDQVKLAFEEVENVDPYVAFAINFEDGPFTDERGERLRTVAVATVEAYKPKYLSLGVESNSFFLFQPETYDLYVEYVREIYDEIKSISPSTMVMNNFQLDRMKGETSLTGEEFESHWELIDRFAGKIDLISFTVYPFLHYSTVEQIPEDYLSEIREHSDLPVIITETGWPTVDLISGVTGSDQAQADYIKKLAFQANEIGVEAVIWVFPHDAQFGIAGGIFDHISLLENDGTPKLGYEYWKALYSLPKN